MRAKHLIATSVTLTVLIALGALSVRAQVANGFDLTEASVPMREIRSGGVPRDGIPALTDPARWSGEQADRWLDDDARILGVVFGGVAMAYPLNVLTRHEVINDVVGGQPIAVTYCPLCRSAVVFDGEVEGERRIFGVSGLLYRSDLLMFDRATGSLVSQLLLQGITGPLRDMPMRTLPTRHTSWERWYADHPQTRVLSRDVMPIDYGFDPYATYHRSGTTMFPVRGSDRSRRAKSFAYALLSSERTVLIVEQDLIERADGQTLTFQMPDAGPATFDPEAGELRVDPSRWRLIPGYWFALTAFFPDADRWDALRLEQAIGSD